MKSLFTDPHDGDWRQQLGQIFEMMRHISRQTDPQEIARAYSERIRLLLPSDRAISLSRRGLTTPKYRITRSTPCEENINPWKERDCLTVFEGGLLAELNYGDVPKVIDSLDVAPGCPAAHFLAEHRSLMSRPANPHAGRGRLASCGWLNRLAWWYNPQT
jgi:sigma-B regulation protein RsbU (phosphoserine phosphatase)